MIIPRCPPARGCRVRGARSRLDAHCATRRLVLSTTPRLCETMQGWRGERRECLGRRGVFECARGARAVSSSYTWVTFPTET
eukprot:2485090-Prymnesium_polylepis.1